MTSDASERMPEVKAAVDFLTQLVKQRSRGMARSALLPSPDVLETLSGALLGVLVAHYADHWFPGQPWRGGAYRCIRINGKMDPLVAKAGLACGVEPERLRAFFPPELTVWIDPGNVSYRIGEEGSVCELYSGASGDLGGPPKTLSRQASQPSSAGAAINNSQQHLPSAKSMPVMGVSSGYPSPASSPQSYTSTSSSSQRSSPMPVLNFSSDNSSSSHSSTNSSGSLSSGASSFGFQHPPSTSPSVVESLASLVMISSSADPFGSPQRVPPRMPNMPTGPAVSCPSPASGFPPHPHHLTATGNSAVFMAPPAGPQQQSSSASQQHHQLIFTEQARGAPATGWQGYYPPASSGHLPHHPYTTTTTVCKDNLDRLVECMAPLCIASMGSA